MVGDRHLWVLFLIDVPVYGGSLLLYIAVSNFDYQQYCPYSVLTQPYPPNTNSLLCICELHVYGRELNDERYHTVLISLMLSTHYS